MIGRQLLHYEITEKLGEGGMGVVYKARDSHLDRIVALKVLPPERVADPDRKRRFVQEARAASALNHQNIITVHDITADQGVDFIVLEYVQGKPLDELIPRRGMRLDQLLKIAVQIADALAAAHARGIIHRDLKPANIMVTGAGLVKVLDFGLAKLTEAATREEAATRTLTEGPRTEEGAIVGTVAYMSPEQAEGSTVDPRSDIFSFGIILYEMAAGRQPFRADTRMKTLSAILSSQPPPLTGLPHDLEKLIARCLRKDPGRRFQHMDDVKVALEELKEDSDSGKLAAAQRAVRRPRRALMCGALLIAAAAAATLWLTTPAGRTRAVPSAPVLLTSFEGKEAYASFSPDGNQTVFAWNGPEESNWDIFVKLIATEAARRLTTDPGADLDPAWSPDGNQIAFIRIKLDKRVQVVLIPSIGGPERTLGEIRAPASAVYRRLAWSPDGKGLVVVDRESNQEPFALFWLPLSGGEKRRLTSPPAGWWGDRDPAVSPDGRTLVFSRARTDNLSELHRISVSPQMTAAGDAVRLTNLQRYTISPAWSADGRDLIFASGSSYWTTLWRVRASGAGRAEPLPFAAEGSWQTAMAPSGRRLAYTASYYDWNIWRVDLAETGRAAAAPRALISSTRQDGSPGYSPDGTRIAFTSKRSGGNEVWVCDSDGSNPLKLTALGAAYPLAPEWSPDGHWISFIAPGDGREDLLVIGAQGGEPRRVAGDVSRAAQPRWSADGRWIYFSSTRSGTERIWRVPAQGGEPTLTPRLHLGPASADGQFVFFTKDEGASLWKAPAEGGAEVLVVDGFHAKSFAVVKEGVYFVFREEPAGGMRRTLKFYRFADGSTRAVFELPAPKVALAGAGDSRLAVSPDGRAIAYEQQDQNVWDLMLVENFR